MLDGYGLLPAMTRQGTAMVGPSPFHEGDAPSFRVDLERGIWNDFQGRPEGCRGNVVGLVQALEGCPFPTALRIVAERFAEPHDGSASQTPPVTDDEAPEERAGPPPTRARPRQPRGPGTVTPEGADLALPQGSSADDPEAEAPLFGKELGGLRYDVPLLAERGISSATAKTYGVGYCSRGLMKSRLVAPVHTPEGEIAGYVGRAVRPVPRTELWKNPAGFPRSHYLFGLHRATETGAGRKAVKDYGLVVVQSPLDVLRLQEAGYPNGVALMAATLSRRQLELLVTPALNPTRRVTLLLDNDAAGQAGKREAATALIHHAYVRYACWKALQTEHTSPDRLDNEALRQLLTLSRTPATT
ncbi:MAG: toprim domain-containing protein [Myxococcales bacterium]|nr:toprim domain-containing protein [Myxococcales bacterium]